MKIPTPGELGLPEKYDVWRPTQAEGLRLMATDTKRITNLVIPTGGGKTAMYIAGALMSGKATCIVTDNLGLQDQAVEEFGSCGLVDLRGKANYECGLRSDYTCAEGSAARCPYKGSTMCPASLAEIKSSLAPVTITSYAKWTTSKLFGTGMNHFQQVIFDEGHNLPKALESAMQITLNHKEVEESLGMDFLGGSDADNFREWKGWAKDARGYAEDAVVSARNRIQNGQPKGSWVKHYLHMKHLASKLAILSTANADGWIAEQVDKGYQFDPIRAGRYAEGALLMRIPRIIVGSASLRPKTMFMIGQGTDQFSFHEFQSEFDPKRCPTYYVPTMRVDRSAQDLTPLWRRLEQIMGRRRDRKGIIHTISYARQREVLDTSRFSDSMIFNDQGDPTPDTIRRYLEAGPGATLVGPSFGTGYDFPMDSCEWQFIAKVPFPDGRAKILKARQDPDQGGDKEYGAYHAMQKLEQALGRGMRRTMDRCESFLGDDHIAWFSRKFGHLASKTFHARLRTVSIIPSPAEKL